MYEDSISVSQENLDWNYSVEEGSLVISNEKSQIDDKGIVVTGVLTNEGDLD